MLRVAGNNNHYPYLLQFILTPGKRYKVTGYARSDGNTYLHLSQTYDVWTGGQSANWQAFDFDMATMGQATAFYVGGYTSTKTGYTEWDDLSVREILP